MHFRNTGTYTCRIARRDAFKWFKLVCCVNSEPIGECAAGTVMFHNLTIRRPRPEWLFRRIGWKVELTIMTRSHIPVQPIGIRGVAWDEASPMMMPEWLVPFPALLYPRADLNDLRLEHAHLVSLEIVPEAFEVGHSAGADHDPCRQDGRGEVIGPPCASLGLSERSS